MYRSAGLSVIERYRQDYAALPLHHYRSAEQSGERFKASLRAAFFSRILLDSLGSSIIARLVLNDCCRRRTSALSTVEREPLIQLSIV